MQCHNILIGITGGIEMDFLQGVREATIGESAKTLVDEGLVTAGTFIGTSFIGGQTEKFVLPKDAEGNPIPITEISSTSDKVKAWAGNNVPKIVAWMYLKKSQSPTNELMKDASKALATSIFYDSLVRVSNSGIAPAYPTVFGLGDESVKGTETMSKNDIQQLLQENAVLKQQITKMVRGLPSNTDVQTSQEPRPERQREYGFMNELEPPIVDRRRTQFGFAGETADQEQVAEMFGML